MTTKPEHSAGLDERARTVARAVDGDALWQDLETLAGFGPRSDGGVCRLALDDNDIAAREWLAAQATALGAEPGVDAAGNVFLCRPGSDPEAAPVLIGSHLDSQPTGGRYDGSYGVLAGVAVLRALANTGVQTRHPVAVVSWTNEEGVRFAPGTSGAACFAGARTLEATRELSDSDGVTFGEAVDACLERMDRAGAQRWLLGTPAAAFVEPHIEQGPILERGGHSTGVVSGVQGSRWFRFRVQGLAAHAGTTPRAARRDALEGACTLIAELRATCHDSSDQLRFTVGRLDVTPGAINTVPEAVVFTVDLRHPETPTLDAIEQDMRSLAHAEWAGCPVVMETISSLDPVAFDGAVTSALAQAGESLGLASPEMISGAFHDAVHLAGHCPTGMLFIPCKDGVSHHPDESIEPRDALAGARLLAATAVHLALGQR